MFEEGKELDDALAGLDAEDQSPRLASVQVGEVPLTKKRDPLARDQLARQDAPPVGFNRMICACRHVPYSIIRSVNDTRGTPPSLVHGNN